MKVVEVKVSISFHGAWVYRTTRVDWDHWSGSVYRALIQQAIDEYTHEYGWGGMHGTEWMLANPGCIRHSAVGPYGPIKLPPEPARATVAEYEMRITP